MAYTPPYEAMISGFVSTPGGLAVPTRYIQDSKQKQITAAEMAWGNTTNLVDYVRWQLQQSRYKYFVMDAIYQADSWVRASIEYITAANTREPDRLEDRTDPFNPDIRDICAFFDDCNEETPFSELRAGIYQDMLTYGYSCQFIRYEKGLPVGLEPMDARITFPIFDFHGKTMFYVQVWNGQVEFFHLNEVLYFPMPALSGRMPVSKIETLYESVSMEANANKYNMHLFKNGLNIGAVLSIPNATDEDIQDNLRLLDDHYATPENAGRPLILKNDAKLVRDGQVLTKDINFEGLIDLARKRVCAVYLVPESLLGFSQDANRSTTDTDERSTYDKACRPPRTRVNFRYSRFIHKHWSPSVNMVEPLSAMLPNLSQLQAVNEVAKIGATFNDLREMQGFSRIANGDYLIALTPNGYQRLDLIAMPGAGDPHWDAVAYQLEHEARAAADQENAMATGMPAASAPPQPYIPVRPQEQIRTEPISARIVDVSRSLAARHFDWDIAEDALLLVETWGRDGMVSRRIPKFPGTRGGNYYQTASGKVRYGRPPKDSRPPVDKEGTPSDNTLTNPHDPAAPPTLSPEEKQAMDAARGQVETLFRQAQEENWTDDQFFGKLEGEGWQIAADTRSEFHDVRDARSEARRLAELYPDKAYVLLGSNGKYFVYEHPLADFQPQVKGVGEGKKKEEVSRATTSLDQWGTQISALRGLARGTR